jgi:hypothetical protein
VPRGATIVRIRDPIFAANEGEFRVVVFCGWKLFGESGELLASDEMPALAPARLRQLLGAVVSKATCDGSPARLKLFFSNGLELRIRESGVEDEEQPSFRVWRGDDVLNVGPSNRWLIERRPTSSERLH